MLGVVQEQHAERAKLYKQWKRYEFPIVQDATTQLDLWAVPFAFLVDEYGVIRERRFNKKSLETFVATTYEPPKEANSRKSNPRSKAEIQVADGNLAIHGKQQDFEKAIKLFSQAVAEDPENGKAHFSLGVAYRMRLDSDSRRNGDFENAYKHWNRALTINPNQYIWRRRIEQYGPKLTKPYPFYNWVEKANKEILARGEKPTRLTATLTSTETATNGSSSSIDSSKNPDPESKVFPDENNFVTIGHTIVPSVIKQKNTVRIHLEFEITNAKWNEEADPLTIWIDESSDGEPETRIVRHRPKGGKPEDMKPKSLDFEFNPSGKQGNIRGYALFHCCDKDGVCFYYRKDFQIPFDLN